VSSCFNYHLISLVTFACLAKRIEVTKLPIDIVKRVSGKRFELRSVDEKDQSGLVRYRIFCLWESNERERALDGNGEFTSPFVDDDGLAIESYLTPVGVFFLKISPILKIS